MPLNVVNVRWMQARVMRPLPLYRALTMAMARKPVTRISAPFSKSNRCSAADTKVKQTQIASKRNNECPHSVASIAEMVYDERREEEIDRDRDRVASPIGKNVAKYPRMSTLLRGDSCRGRSLRHQIPSLVRGMKIMQHFSTVASSCPDRPSDRHGQVHVKSF